MNPTREDKETTLSSAPSTHAQQGQDESRLAGPESSDPSLTPGQLPVLPSREVSEQAILPARPPSRLMSLGFPTPSSQYSSPTPSSTPRAPHPMLEPLPSIEVPLASLQVSTPTIRLPLVSELLSSPSKGSATRVKPGPVRSPVSRRSDAPPFSAPPGLETPQNALQSSSRETLVSQGPDRLAPPLNPEMPPPSSRLPDPPLTPLLDPSASALVFVEGLSTPETPSDRRPSPRPSGQNEAPEFSPSPSPRRDSPALRHERTGLPERPPRNPSSSHRFRELEPETSPSSGSRVPPPLSTESRSGLKPPLSRGIPLSTPNQTQDELPSPRPSEPMAFIPVLDPQRLSAPGHPSVYPSSEHAPSSPNRSGLPLPQPGTRSDGTHETFAPDPTPLEQGGPQGTRSTPVSNDSPEPLPLVSIPSAPSPLVSSTGASGVPTRGSTAQSTALSTALSNREPPPARPRAYARSESEAASFRPVQPSRESLQSSTPSHPAPRAGDPSDGGGQLEPPSPLQQGLLTGGLLTALGQSQSSSGGLSTAPTTVQPESPSTTPDQPGARLNPSGQTQSDTLEPSGRGGTLQPSSDLPLVELPSPVPSEGLRPRAFSTPLPSSRPDALHFELDRLKEALTDARSEQTRRKSQGSEPSPETPRVPLVAPLTVPLVASLSGSRSDTGLQGLTEGTGSPSGPSSLPPLSPGGSPGPSRGPEVSSPLVRVTPLPDESRPSPGLGEHRRGTPSPETPPRGTPSRDTPSRDTPPRGTPSPETPPRGTPSPETPLPDSSTLGLKPQGPSSGSPSPQDPPLLGASSPDQSLLAQPSPDQSLLDPSLLEPLSLPVVVASKGTSPVQDWETLARQLAARLGLSLPPGEDLTVPTPRAVPVSGLKSSGTSSPLAPELPSQPGGSLGAPTTRPRSNAWSELPPLVQPLPPLEPSTSTSEAPGPVTWVRSTPVTPSDPSATHSTTPSDTDISRLELGKHREQLPPLVTLPPQDPVQDNDLLPTPSSGRWKSAQPQKRSQGPISGNTGSGSTGTGNTGSGHTGTGHTGSGNTGTGSTGSGHTGSGNTGTGHTGSGSTGTGHTGLGSTPQYPTVRLSSLTLTDLEGLDTPDKGTPDSDGDTGAKVGLPVVVLRLDGDGSTSDPSLLNALVSGNGTRPDGSQSSPPGRGTTTSSQTGSKSSNNSSTSGQTLQKSPGGGPTDPLDDDTLEALSDAGLNDDVQARQRMARLKRVVSLDELVAIHQHLETLPEHRRYDRLQELLRDRRRKPKADLGIDMPSHISPQDRRLAIQAIETLMRENDGMQSGRDDDDGDSDSSSSPATLDRTDLAEVAFELRWRLRQQERWEAEAW